MITLDSNKIEAPQSVLKYFNQDRQEVVQSIQQSQGEVLGDKYTIAGVAPGFNYFELNNKKGTILLGTSAKILKDNYLQGITVNTIEQVIDEVNRQGQGIFEIDVAEFIETGRFLSVDATNNLRIDTEPLKYLEALNAYKINSKYRVDYNNKKNNQGIVFQGSQKSFKERIIFYDKRVELMYKPESRVFLETVSNVPKLLKDCATILRVEQNSVQLRKIRERFNVGDTKVLSVLESPSKPNYNLTLKIVKGVEQLELFGELDRFQKFYQFEKHKGMETIIRECNYDIGLIEQIVRHYVSEKTNVYQYLKPYKTLAFSMIEKDRIKKTNETGLVDIVLELLKAC